MTVADLVAHLDARIPFAWAEPWDAVGLLAGDPAAPVPGVLVSLDPTRQAVDRALEAGASVLLTHHPAFLEPPPRLVAGGGVAGLAWHAARAGVALVACHTNLDRSPEGADALPAALGLKCAGPLEQGAQEVSLVVVYAPGSSTDKIRSAMSAAGAGRIGRYEECAFLAEGIGAFTPLEGASPAFGVAGQRSQSSEVRIEMICPRRRTECVLSAAREAHPYEEPVVTSCDGSIGRGAARMGRLCEAADGTTVGTLAELVSRRLGVRARVWGRPETPARLVAIAPGSGRSLVSDALARGADALVTGELRYHDAREALEAGLSVLEAGHDATEWPLARALAAIASEAPWPARQAVVLDRVEYPWWTA
jgi:dinuclear metal center YbgI/SA1388 family protein